VRKNEKKKKKKGTKYWKRKLNLKYWWFIA